MRGNAVVHWELMSKQLEKVADFYAKIFLVDDLPKHRKKVVAAGGKIHIEEQKVPKMGKFALFTDPEGRMMGLWKAST